MSKNSKINIELTAEFTAGFIAEESRWQAVLERNRMAADTFYYAVKTTGIFCRPGCSSRLPKRENVAFFDSCHEAQQAGYRPCKRCEPGTISLEEQQSDVIIQACRRLEQSETRLTLNELAAEAYLSPSHFHRLFKKIVGVTPKQYATAQQAKRFQGTLKSSPSITEAIYDADFGSNNAPTKRGE